MRALSFEPGVRDSIALEEVGEPAERAGSVLAACIAVGVCGTDLQLIQGTHAAPSSDRRRIVIGHEALARVQEAPNQSGFCKGDLIVPIVRHPDPVPCANCAVGEVDMCRNGLYTECGIKERDGFCTERLRVEPDHFVKIDQALGYFGVLVEPASVVAKAWDHIERIGRRAYWAPQQVLITGAGPVGLMAAMMAVQRRFEVHVLDRNAEGLKPALVHDLGASYHSGSIAELGFSPDVIIECTGAAALIQDALYATGRGGIVCLAGITSGQHYISLDIDKLNRSMVLENDVVFGCVNANRAHYLAAAQALAEADREWLSRIITRRVPIERWKEAYQRREGDVKTTIDFAGGLL